MKKVKLGEIIKLVGGGTPSKINATFWEGNIPWASVKDMNTEYIFTTQDSISVEGVKGSATNIIPTGTLIIATRMAVGRVGFAMVDLAINQDLKAIFCSDVIFNKYLFYFLKSNSEYFDRVSSGATVKGLKINHIRDIEIPLPPLTTQQRIASILDEADALRKKTQLLIDSYDELAQSIFLDMFGDTRFNPKQWQIRHLEEICSSIVDCPHSTPKYVDEITDYPCIRTTELKNGNIDWSSMKYLDLLGHIERTKRIVPKEGDIIYGREGTFGEAIIIPPSINISLGQRVMLFRPKYEIVSSAFLHSVIRSPGLYYQALRVNTGSTVGHVNVADIKKFQIILPPITLQNQFADKITLIYQQKELAKQSLKESEDLFNTLLQKAFKGELELK